MFSQYKHDPPLSLSHAGRPPDLALRIFFASIIEHVHPLSVGAEPPMHLIGCYGMFVSPASVGATSRRITVARPSQQRQGRGRRSALKPPLSPTHATPALSSRAGESAKLGGQPPLRWLLLSPSSSAPQRSSRRGRRPHHIYCGTVRLSRVRHHLRRVTR